MILIIISLFIIGSSCFSSSSKNSISYHRTYRNGFYYSNGLISPSLQFDIDFESEIVSKEVIFYWRDVDFAFGITFQHPDVIFSLANKNEYLVLGFHEEDEFDGHRYEATRITKQNFQNLKIYDKKEYKYLNKQTSVLKILLLADEIAQKEYSLMTNNCIDSANEIIKRLNQY